MLKKDNKSYNFILYFLICLIWFFLEPIILKQYFKKKPEYKIKYSGFKLNKQHFTSTIYLTSQKMFFAKEYRFEAVIPNDFHRGNIGTLPECLLK